MVWTPPLTEAVITEDRLCLYLPDVCVIGAERNVYLIRMLFLLALNWPFAWDK